MGTEGVLYSVCLFLTAVVVMCRSASIVIEIPHEFEEIKKS